MEVYFAGNIISLNGGLFIVTFYRRVAEDSPNQPTNQPTSCNQPVATNHPQPGPDQQNRTASTAAAASVRCNFCRGRAAAPLAAVGASRRGRARAWSWG